MHLASGLLLLLLSALFQRPETSHDGSPGDAHACTAPRITHRTFSSPSRRRPRRPLSHSTAQYSSSFKSDAAPICILTHTHAQIACIVSPGSLLDSPPARQVVLAVARPLSSQVQVQVQARSATRTVPRQAARQPLPDADAQVTRNPSFCLAFRRRSPEHSYFFSPSLLLCVCGWVTGNE